MSVTTALRDLRDLFGYSVEFDVYAFGDTLAMIGCCEMLKAGKCIVRSYKRTYMPMVIYFTVPGKQKDDKKYRIVLHKHKDAEFFGMYLIGGRTVPGFNAWLFDNVPKLRGKLMKLAGLSNDE